MLVFSRHQEKSDQENVALIAVQAVLAGSKPTAAVDVRISTGERHDFGATAPLSTRASCLVQGRAGGPVENLMGRLGPFLQKAYPHASLELQQRFPCASES